VASNDDIREFDVYLGHVNRLVERRQAVTTTYISVNVALTGAMAFLLSGPRAATNVATLVLLCAGVIAATFWRRIIGQYRVLLDWWYGQLRVLEMATPHSSKLITKEYEELYGRDQGQHKRSKIALGLADYEVGLTWLFTAIYAIAGAAIVTSLVLHRSASP